jgi:hypothetical protein
MHVELQAQHPLLVAHHIVFPQLPYLRSPLSNHEIVMTMFVNVKM